MLSSLGDGLLGALVGGLVVGGGIYLWLQGRYRRHLRSLEAQVAAREAEVQALQRQMGVLEGTNQTLQQQVASFQETQVRMEGALRETQAARAAAEARLQEAQEAIGRQRQLLEEAQQRLSEAFRALAAEALQSNNEGFLILAREQLQQLYQEATHQMEGRHKALEGLVQPLREALDRMDARIRELEKARSEAYGALMEQVRALIETQNQLRHETGALVQALRVPSARGRWGEIQLQRVVELAGMMEHCDFVRQRTTEGTEGLLRPDLVVHLPGGQQIVVDAKVSLQAFLEALEAPDEARRRERLQEHARHVREHIRRLSGKAYWSQFSPSPEFVVLFLPGEGFFSAALEADPSLIESGVEHRVLVATPTTLIALLRAVAYGWRQEQVAENAQRIQEVARELSDRLARMLDHFGRLGRHLRQSVETFNQTVGSLEQRVLPMARRIQDLGVTPQRSLPPVSQVEQIPRSVDSESNP